MSEQEVLLGSMDEVWAKMLMEVLENNGVLCRAEPVFGYALSVKTGGSDIWKIYVPAMDLERAKALSDELFSGGGEEALKELFPDEENEELA